MAKTDRTRTLNDKSVSDGPIVYWMIRDQRAEDNWALLEAQNRALELKQPLHVVMAFRPDLHKFLGTRRMFEFMATGLQETAKTLKEKNISFFGYVGDPVKEVSKHLKKYSGGCLVTDFFPLPVYTHWHTEIAQQAECAVMQVDAHNVIPCWETSPKQEYAARTIRPKIHKKLNSFLTDFPRLKKHPHGTAQVSVAWDDNAKAITLEESVTAVSRKPGSAAAHTQLKTFVQKKLAGYAEKRNEPTAEALSDLSPYLHFGQISAQRVAYEVQRAEAPKKDIDAYLEELIVRRELSDNFCFYAGDKALSLDGAPEWARKTLSAHAKDEREFTYSRKQFEQVETHDDYWNAAQQELLQTGKMHGYMRMYWGKKILEWSKDASDAVATAIYLNDKYELDGRDPNGYVGILWSIAGLHDRPWFEREIYGTVRYMAASGLERKFDIKAYAKKWLPK